MPFPYGANQRSRALPQGHRLSPKEVHLWVENSVVTPEQTQSGW